jgi:outer membrane receptor protein involved in Fe transport
MENWVIDCIYHHVQAFYTMKKLLLLGTFSLFVSTNLLAQFPMMGGMDGGRRNKENTAIPGTAQATPKGSGKISGYVIDSSNTKAIEFASVALINKATNKPVDGAICDVVGKFSITRVPIGEYKVVVSFMGYKNTTIDDVKIINKNDEVDLSVIKVSLDNRVLQEVTVEGQKAIIEDKVDRLVYNADRDATSKGGDASDVLRKVPMLSVDLDGNVSLRGSQNIKVLINNKPSTIVASSVADALKQIPADMIKTVEVITSPSAKYDAEGSAGIINIITKKNNLQGLTLNMDTSVGIRGGNLMLNGNYRKGNMGFSLGGHGRANYNVYGDFYNEQVTSNSDGSKTFNTQKADTRNQGLWGNYQLGWDWDINKTNTVSASARFGVRNGHNYQDRLLNQRFSGTNLLSSNVRDVDISDLSGNVDLNVDYTHTFKKPQQELSFSTQYSRNNRTNDFINSNLDINTYNVLSRLKNENQSYNQEITVQSDYQAPIGKKQLVEFGVKGIFRQVNSDFQYFFAKGSDSPYLPISNAATPSNVFDYDQNIVGTYGSWTSTLSKTYTLKTGLRYEFTDITANFKGDKALTIPSYGVWVPSINISKKLKGGSTLKAAYNRRIQRPSIQFLNPNINAANPLNISYGNPELNPEYTNNYELTLNTFFKNTFLTVSTFMRNTTAAIESIRDVIGRDTLRTTYQNIGNQDAYGFNAFGNINLSNKFMLGLGGDVYYASLKNNNPNPNYSASNTGWVANFRAFGSYTLGKSWGLQVFGFMRSTQVQLQGYQGGMGIYSLSLKKDFKDKKGSLGFGFENFFTPNGFKIRNELTSPILTQKSVTTLQNLNFKVNFSYRIGKMTFADSRKKKKSVNNDDLKDGGEGGGGGQQGGGAAPAATPAPGGGRPK